jgi:CheY-like chemotaxis protein
LRTALDRNIPAIVMTGDVRSEIVDSIAGQGISVLIKPFSADELLQHVTLLCQGSISGNPAGAAGS